MIRALVLNAGASWAAYQIGALRFLLGERQLRFDLCVGTGIGAMNAALVACGAFEALEAFWHRIGWTSLVRPNFTNPWSGGPTRASPQRKFIERHVSAARLADEGTRLKFSALNLETGRTDTFSYPGCDVPLTDALMSAVALPGVTPPGMIRGHQYVEGTVVRGFILTDVLQEPVDEIYAIGAAASQPHRFEAGTRFDTWRAVMQRAMQLNQSHDIWHELNLARTRLRGRRARAEVHRALPGSLSRLVPDAEVAERLRARLAMIYPSHDAPVEPVLHVLTPSRDLDFPLWRFRRRDIVGAIDLGFADAQRDLAAPSVEGVR